MLWNVKITKVCVEWNKRDLILYLYRAIDYYTLLSMGVILTLDKRRIVEYYTIHIYRYL